MGNRLISFRKPFVLRILAKNCNNKLYFGLPGRIKQISTKILGPRKFMQDKIVCRETDISLMFTKSRSQGPVTFHMSKLGQDPANLLQEQLRPSAFWIRVQSTFSRCSPCSLCPVLSWKRWGTFVSNISSLPQQLATF